MPERMDDNLIRGGDPERILRAKQEEANRSLSLEEKAEGMNEGIAWGFIKNDPKLKAEIEDAGGWPLLEKTCDEIGVRRGLDAVQVAAAAMALKKRGEKTVH